MKILLRGKNFNLLGGGGAWYSDIFWRQSVDAGSNPTYEEKVRVPPPTHTHTHLPWVIVYDKKLLARWSVMADWVISGDFIEDASC